MPRQGAALNVAGHRSPVKAHALTALNHLVGTGIDLVGLVNVNLLLLADLIKIGGELVGRQPVQTVIIHPALENPVRRALHDTATDHGRTSNAAAFREHDISGGIHLPCLVAPDQLHGITQVLSELGTRIIASAFEDQHVQARLGELIGSHGATAAGANNDGISA